MPFGSSDSGRRRYRQRVTEPGAGRDTPTTWPNPRPRDLPEATGLPGRGRVLPDPKPGQRSSQDGPPRVLKWKLPRTRVCCSGRPVQDLLSVPGAPPPGPMRPRWPHPRWMGAGPGHFPPRPSQKVWSRWPRLGVWVPSAHRVLGTCWGSHQPRRPHRATGRSVGSVGLVMGNCISQSRAQNDPAPAPSGLFCGWGPGPAVAGGLGHLKPGFSEGTSSWFCLCFCQFSQD